MKNSTRIAIAGLLSAAGSVLTALASEFNSEAPASPESAATPTPEPAKPVKTKKEKPAAPVVEEKPAEPETPAEPAEEPSASGKTYEDMKAVIAPLVQEGRGEEVKQVIRKHAGAEGTLKTMDPKFYGAFEKDIQALTY